MINEIVISIGINPFIYINPVSEAQMLSDLFFLKKSAK
jgi:hypothetical protein